MTLLVKFDTDNTDLRHFLAPHVAQREFERVAQLLAFGGGRAANYPNTSRCSGYWTKGLRDSTPQNRCVHTELIREKGHLEQSIPRCDTWLDRRVEKNH